MPSPECGKLNDEVQSAVCAALAAGNTLAVAARVAGVGPRSLRRWLSAGRAGGGPRCVALLAAVKKAEADCVARTVLFIQDAMPKTWQAAAWWLERKYPADWGSDRREIAALKQELAEIRKLVGPTPAPAPPVGPPPGAGGEPG